MKIEALGDSALILRELAQPAYLVAEAIDAAKIPGLIEAVASYETVGVYFDPLLFDSSVFQARRILERRFDADEDAESIGNTVMHEIPVCYEMGEDLAEVADRLDLTPEQVVSLHFGQIYRCFAVGFCPGFPYLGHLPERISGIARRADPRVRVPPGSVAITGSQTGVYPIERPGGWAIIGRTPLCIVDPEDAYFPIKAGDEVRFVPIGPVEFEVRKGHRL